MDKAEKEFLIENIELNHFILGNYHLKALLKGNNSLLVDLINELPQLNNAYTAIKVKCKTLGIPISGQFFRGIQRWRHVLAEYLDVSIYEITTVNNKLLITYSKKELTELFSSGGIEKLDNEKESILIEYVGNTTKTHYDNLRMRDPIINF